MPPSGDRLVYSTQGGVTSDMLVQIATGVIQGPHPPSALIFYAGFDDFNKSHGIRIIRRLGLGSSERSGRAFPTRPVSVRIPPCSRENATCDTPSSLPVN